MNSDTLSIFGPDGVCGNTINVHSFGPSPPCPPYPPPLCNTGVNNICVNPANNHIVVYYSDGRIQDTGIATNGNNSCFNTCPLPIITPSNTCQPTVVGCTPRNKYSYLNGVQYTSSGEMIFTYTDGSTCNLGEICKCQNVIFSQNQNPKCGCPIANCGDTYINLETGNIFKFYGYAWDTIGNMRGPTGAQGISGYSTNTGATGPTGPANNNTLWGLEVPPPPVGLTGYANLVYDKANNKYVWKNASY